MELRPACSQPGTGISALCDITRLSYHFKHGINEYHFSEVGFLAHRTVKGRFYHLCSDRLNTLLLETRNLHNMGPLKCV